MVKRILKIALAAIAAVLLMGVALARMIIRCAKSIR